MLKTPEVSDMKKESVRVRGKNRITIPSSLAKALDIHEGEELEARIENGHIVLVPIMTIEKDQRWYWTESWQQAEREAEADFAAGRSSGPMDVEDAIHWLHEPDDED